ncbi:hypothetical protein ACOSQ2_032021 [Xanthoceras sorbifolium]
MAVQAQYRLNAFSEEHEQLLQHQTSNLMIQNPLMAGGTESDLTSCNAYGYLKRTRDNEIMFANSNHLQHQNQRSKLLVADNASGFGTASTSGRHADQDLDSYIDNQSLELRAFIRLQNQKLRAMVGLIVEKQILRKVEEKERELERAKRVRRELEEKVKQKSEENQMWFNVAKQSEATVFSLRQSLVQLLLYNNNDGNNNHNHAIEGFGETNGVDDIDDAQSPIQQLIKNCKGCGGGDASVLLLPCRHLCLCKHCEFRFNCCPVCNSVKNAALNVFYS